VLGGYGVGDVSPAWVIGGDGGGGAVAWSGRWRRRGCLAGMTAGMCVAGVAAWRCCLAGKAAAAWLLGGDGGGDV